MQVHDQLAAAARSLARALSPLRSVPAVRDFIFGARDRAFHAQVLLDPAHVAAAELITSSSALSRTTASGETSSYFTTSNIMIIPTQTLGGTIVGVAVSHDSNRSQVGNDTACVGGSQGREWNEACVGRFAFQPESGELLLYAFVVTECFRCGDASLKFHGARQQAGSANCHNMNACARVSWFSGVQLTNASHAMSVVPQTASLQAVVNHDLLIQNKLHQAIVFCRYTEDLVRLSCGECMCSAVASQVVRGSGGAVGISRPDFCSCPIGGWVDLDAGKQTGFSNYVNAQTGLWSGTSICLSAISGSPGQVLASSHCLATQIKSSKDPSMIQALQNIGVRSLCPCEQYAPLPVEQMAIQEPSPSEAIYMPHHDRMRTYPEPENFETQASRSQVNSKVNEIPETHQRSETGSRQESWQRILEDDSKLSFPSGSAMTCSDGRFEMHSEDDSTAAKSTPPRGQYGIPAGFQLEHSVASSEAGTDRTRKTWAQPRRGGRFAEKYTTQKEKEIAQLKRKQKNRESASRSNLARKRRIKSVQESLRSSNATISHLRLIESDLRKENTRLRQKAGGKFI